MNRWILQRQPLKVPIRNYDSARVDNGSVGFREASKTGVILFSTQASFSLMVNFLVAFCSPAIVVANEQICSGIMTTVVI